MTKINMFIIKLDDLLFEDMFFSYFQIFFWIISIFTTTKNYCNYSTKWWSKKASAYSIFSLSNQSLGNGIRAWKVFVGGKADSISKAITAHWNTSNHNKYACAKFLQVFSFIAFFCFIVSFTVKKVKALLVCNIIALLNCHYFFGIFRSFFSCNSLIIISFIRLFFQFQIKIWFRKYKKKFSLCFLLYWTRFILNTFQKIDEPNGKESIHRMLKR